MRSETAAPRCHPCKLRAAARARIGLLVTWLVDTQNVGAKPFPDFTVRTVRTASSDSERTLDISLCLQHENTGTSTPVDAIFVCPARHPRLSDLDLFLSDSPASVLSDYYVDSLQPCLLMAGQQVSVPPSRSVLFVQNRRRSTANGPRHAVLVDL